MRILVVIAALLLPVQALALSCTAMSVTHTYKQAAGSSDVYVVVHGRMTFSERKLPKFDESRPGATNDPVIIKGHLTGQMMSQSGFDTPFDAPVSVIARCFGPWCAQAKSGISYLAFVKRTGSTFSVEINPCGGDVFSEPNAAHLDQALACHQGKRCVGVKY